MAYEYTRFKRKLVRIQTHTYATFHATHGSGSDKLNNTTSFNNTRFTVNHSVKHLSYDTFRRQRSEERPGAEEGGGRKYNSCKHKII